MSCRGSVWPGPPSPEALCSCPQPSSAGLEPPPGLADLARQPPVSTALVRTLGQSWLLCPPVLPWGA